MISMVTYKQISHNVLMYLLLHLSVYLPKPLFFKSLQGTVFLQDRFIITPFYF